MLYAWALETIFDVEVQMIGDESTLSAGRKRQLRRGRLLKRLVEQLELENWKPKGS